LRDITKEKSSNEYYWKMSGMIRDRGSRSRRAVRRVSFGGIAMS